MKVIWFDNDDGETLVQFFTLYFAYFTPLFGTCCVCVSDWWWWKEEVHFMSRWCVMIEESERKVEFLKTSSTPSLNGDE